MSVPTKYRSWRMLDWVSQLPKAAWAAAGAVVTALVQFFVGLYRSYVSQKEAEASKAAAEASQAEADVSQQEAISKAEQRIRDDLEDYWREAQQEAARLENQLRDLQSQVRPLEHAIHDLTEDYNQLYACFETLSRKIQRDSDVNWCVSDVIDVDIDGPVDPEDILPDDT